MLLCHWSLPEADGALTAISEQQQAGLFWGAQLLQHTPLGSPHTHTPLQLVLHTALPAPLPCWAGTGREKLGVLLGGLQSLGRAREGRREAFIITYRTEGKADKYISVGSRCTCTLKRCSRSDSPLPSEIKDLALPTFTPSCFPEGTDLREGECCHLQTAQANAPAPASSPPLPLLKRLIFNVVICFLQLKKSRTCSQQ